MADNENKPEGEVLAGVRGVHVPTPMDDLSFGVHLSHDEKATKQEAGYREGTGPKACAHCEHFCPGSDPTIGACYLVRGKIGGAMLCDYFTQKDSMSLTDGGSDGTGDQVDPTDPDDDGDDDTSPEGDTDHDYVAHDGGHFKPTTFYDLSKTRILADPQSGVHQSWVPVFPEGVFHHPEYGELDFREDEIRRYMLNWKQKVRKIDIAVDIDHKNEEAVGWVKQLRYDPGVGLFALVEWNHKGAELVADKRYRYISPQFGEYTDEESGEVFDPVLVALTITNFPFLKKMPAIALSEYVREHQSMGATRPVTLAERERRYAAKYGWKPWEARPDAVLADGPKHQMPNGSYPINNCSDVSDAWHLRGHSKAYSKSQVSAYVQRAARSLGCPVPKEAESAEGNNATRRAVATNQEGGKSMATRSAKLDDTEMKETDDGDADMAKADDGDTDMKEADDGDADMAKAADSDGDNDGYDGTNSPTKGGKRASEPTAAKSLNEANAQIKVLRDQLQTVQRQMRLTEVDKQVRSLSEGDIAFGKTVLDKFREVAIKDKGLGELAFDLLEAVRAEGGLVDLSERGREGESDDAENDPLGGRDRSRDGKTGLPVVGEGIVRKAKMFASENKLNWDDMEDRTRAFLAVTGEGKSL